MPKTLLDEILEPGGLTVSFQPIYRLSGEVDLELAMAEGLARGPSHTTASDAAILFEYVRRKREEIRVDRVCIAAALEAARELPVELSVALNVHSSTLERDVDFPSFLEESLSEAEISGERVLLEIVQATTSYDGHRFKRALERLRAIGVGFAIDDFGAGCVSCLTLLEVRPEILKLDRALVKGLHRDPMRFAIVGSIISMAGKIEAQVVAEGVDHERDLEALRELEVDYVQGFLLARPGPAASVTSSRQRPEPRAVPVRARP